MQCRLSELAELIDSLRGGERMDREFKKCQRSVDKLCSCGIWRHQVICPFCGKDNEVSSEKCQFCGYEFYAHKRVSRTVRSDYLFTANTDIVAEESEHTPEKIKSSEPSVSNDPDITVSRMEDDKTEVVEVINSTSDKDCKCNFARRDAIEIIVSLISIIIAVVSIYKWSINREPYDITLDIGIMALLGGIGLVDTIICTAFEGRPPCTVIGTITRSIALIFIFEFQNFITISAFLIIYIISIIYVVYLYSSRKPAIILGIVSMFLFPFLGYVVATIGALIMRESSSGRKRKK